MTKYVYRYPDGAVGFALLFMRVCYACTTFGIAAVLPHISSPGLFHMGAALAALFLVAGFATRLAALFLGIAAGVALFGSEPIQQLLLVGHIGGCVAIALVGAGAFSIDARRHGRRVIRLRTNTPDRGAGD